MLRWSQPQKKRIYQLHEGSAEDKGVLGEKGANICEMHRLGLPVPAAFIITTETCTDFFNKYPPLTSLFDDVKAAVKQMEKQTGRVFHGAGAQTKQEAQLPLLLSVRSAPALHAMPGMTETILNIGINDEVVDIMTRATENSRWAFDTYRRFLQMFGTLVMGVEKEKYEAVLAEARKAANVELDTLLDTKALQEVVRKFKSLAQVPDEPWEQLQMSIEAVFNSWYSPDAMRFRDIHGIPEGTGVGVIVQKMVFGNINALSGSGMACTRDPNTGDRHFNGKFLHNAAGEEVLNPTRQVRTINELGEEFPQLAEKLLNFQHLLESHYRDMQDIEFTVENMELYVLETRKGTRSARAALNIAVSMVDEKLISEREALLRVDPNHLKFFLHPMIDPLKVNVESSEIRDRIMATGISGSAGAVTGRLAFTSAQVLEFAANNEQAILVKYDTSCTEDIVGLKNCAGCVTLHGGYTSHAPTVLRSLGKPCVTATMNQLSIDVLGDELEHKISGKKFKKGDLMTIDGTCGHLYAGELPIIMSGADENFRKIMHWADKYKRVKVFSNTRTLQDVNLANRFGAEGVGLCRTEHMFFADDRVDHVRRAILSKSGAEKTEALMKLLPLQQQDFVDMFLVMGSRPVMVRLLDRPLSDFLPKPSNEDYEAEVLALSSRLGIPPDVCFERISLLQEHNPALGKRGSRVAMSFPELVQLQTKALVGAALELRQHHITVAPQILLPMICTDHEVDIITPMITKASDEICANAWANSSYNAAYVECSVGGMLEVPRACLRADKIAKAKHVKFLSIGTNDLTQLIFGFSREDAHQFMPEYVEKHVVARNPFVSIDVAGVGTMISTAIQRGKSANNHCQIGICGDHAGDPLSVEFFEKVGVDYVSCSPYKVPIAKLAAAQAHIKQGARTYLMNRSYPKLF